MERFRLEFIEPTKTREPEIKFWLESDHNEVRVVTELDRKDACELRDLLEAVIREWDRAVADR